ncbi:MAG: GDYXXLXY domain-containing protein [Candidatus Omnitrophica bacterium]|nr:GDYXXLXY domain-containing protein [Candidatus Omnitrophota bacterium]
MKIRKLSIVLFLLAVLFQIVLLLSIAYYKEASIRSGRKIIVTAIPFDPRSIFRGDYINLTYEFSRIDLKKVARSKDDFYRGELVFVKLLAVNNNWVATEISDTPISASGNNEIIIRGVVNEPNIRNVINVVYGIENYFVPEGKGKAIEKEISAHRATVELSIDKRGDASVCKIFIDNREVAFR